MTDTPAPALPFDTRHPPRHIAIIMDGNGRWAKERGLARVKGHEAGAETVRRMVRTCGEWGVEYLTLYAFSTENWNRPGAEVSALMMLLARYLKQETAELNESNVRLRAIGNLDALPSSARKELDRAIIALNENTGLTLVLALSYGGRDEIVRAAKTLARKCVTGEIASNDIDETAFAAALDTGAIPDPELLVRTAGEMRISNFLLWQSSYAEYYSVEACWPDFGREELASAIAEYQCRKRTYGEVDKGE